MLNGLDLFSGIGGISIGLDPWVKPVAYCEIDRFAQAVLLSRQRDGRLRKAPIWDDIRTLRGEMLRFTSGSSGRGARLKREPFTRATKTVGELRCSG